MNVYRDPGPLSQPLPPVHLRLPLHNGHVSPAEGSLSRVSVPKMGVRARIADWPPRRELSRESLLENGQGVTPESSSGEEGFKRGGMASVPQLLQCSKDAEFRQGRSRSDIPGSSSRFRIPGFAPLRQRSSSEITLSEQDETEVDGRLFRVYGSTSSINVQSVPEESFFDMLSQFQQEMPDQRSAAPARLGELLRAESSLIPSPSPAPSIPRSEDRPDSRVRKKSGGTESSLGTSSLFRKLRSANKGDSEASRSDTEEMRQTVTSVKPWLCVRSFAHYDAQSLLFDLHEAAAQRSYAAQRRNTATGASSASVTSSAAVSLAVSRALALGGAEPTFSSTDDLSLLIEGSTMCMDASDSAGLDSLDSGPQHQLLLTCPNFLNETGSCGERSVSFLSSWVERGEARIRMRCTNASVAVLDVGLEEQATRMDRLEHHCIEHVDLGARYYREYFHCKGIIYIVSA
ncbi:Signal-induced proliferation-associated 1-like protein 3 [Bagarius yarrelli]|uniref:Signal-induced proliferation-associated 1-like protein 3 n=1 Tax=Bagarius yarrelli TaxID=175774 RepID=A0A556V479_BAGYA|nr:Signal-induced proliferation-associated 1-like protein 3 [Bagarius yarrelli]